LNRSTKATPLISPALVVHLLAVQLFHPTNTHSRTESRKEQVTFLQIQAGAAWARAWQRIKCLTTLKTCSRTRACQPRRKRRRLAWGAAVASSGKAAIVASCQLMMLMTWKTCITSKVSEEVSRLTQRRRLAQARKRTGTLRRTGFLPKPQ